MWHLCEENIGSKKGWRKPLKDHCTSLLEKYPESAKEITKWYEVCKVQFPIYLKCWSTDKDVKVRKPIMHEVNFNIPIKLPSGRVVWLRGKFDGVDLIGSTIFLQENKTKGDVDDQSIDTQLDFDLQTMLYLTALTLLRDYTRNGIEFECDEEKIKPFVGNLPNWGARIAGVRYNVVRRPLSGGVGSIRPHKARGNKPAETMPQFYKRLGGVIEENQDHFFKRWKCRITSAEVENFKRQFLIPILEEITTWWEWVSLAHKTNKDPFSSDSEHYGIHYRHPYGTYNPLSEGRKTELDYFLFFG